MGFIAGIIFSVIVILWALKYKKYFLILMEIEKSIKPFQDLLDGDLEDFIFSTKNDETIYFYYKGDSIVLYTYDNSIDILDDDLNVKYGFTDNARNICNELGNNLLEYFQDEINEHDLNNEEDIPEDIIPDDKDLSNNSDFKVEYYMLDENNEKIDLSDPDMIDKLKDMFGDSLKDFSQAFDNLDISDDDDDDSLFKVVSNNNFDVDSILDKISANGIESLSKEEREFLDKQ